MDMFLHEIWLFMITLSNPSRSLSALIMDISSGVFHNSNTDKANSSYCKKYAQNINSDILDLIFLLGFIYMCEAILV